MIDTDWQADMTMASVKHSHDDQVDARLGGLSVMMWSWRQWTTVMQHGQALDFGRLFHISPS
jgi:hypothetical protein